jgi:hypothetical protein
MTGGKEKKHLLPFLTFQEIIQKNITEDFVCGIKSLNLTKKTPFLLPTLNSRNIFVSRFVWLKGREIPLFVQLQPLSSLI